MQGIRADNMRIGRCITSKIKQVNAIYKEISIHQVNITQGASSFEKKINLIENLKHELQKEVLTHQRLL